MNSTKVRRPWLAIAAVLGCTVGDRGGGTLSGGGSAGASATTTTATASDDRSSGHAPSDGSSGGDGGGDGEPTTAMPESSGDAAESSSGPASSSTSSGGLDEGSSSSDSGADWADGVLDITIVAHDDCTITTDPASITVPSGTEFTVNWISAATSVVNVDVAKIDDFNAVPIILGMEPGTSYHDEVRVWCGMLFTGTFDFEITSCFDPQYIPVDCGG